MGHSYVSALFHVVFSTKEGERTIAPEWRPRLWAYLLSPVTPVGQSFPHPPGGSPSGDVDSRSSSSRSTMSATKSP
jgi:hypothetical protein